MGRFLRAIMVMVTASIMAGQASAETLPVAPGTVTGTEWTAYKERFVDDQGRVIDDANGKISHSEGQGYGLILSYLADDKQTFDRIWGFTRDNLMVRPDGLASWKWDPSTSPPVSDPNNATDGDILIAYGLGLAGYGWKDDAKLDAARSLAKTIGKETTIRWRGQRLLLPAVSGFSQKDRDDGPIINLSYWVFEAFPLLQQLAPDTDWLGIAQSGRRLISKARFGETGLPTDWITLAGEAPAPADGFPPEFSYNSIRIPLYLLRAGNHEPALLENFAKHLNSDDGPATLAVDDGERIDPLSEPGYRIIGAALDCVLHETPLPQELTQFQPTTYFGSTLHLLTLSYLRQNAKQCL
jgi:endo-1,4-beta-D-glucanase Y